MRLAWFPPCDVGPSILKVEVRLKSSSRVAVVDSNDLLTVSEVAHRSGFAASALRYYEREGLIAASRTSGGQRRYQRNVLRRLAFIRAARNVGLTLDEVRAELEQLPEFFFYIFKIFVVQCRQPAFKPIGAKHTYLVQKNCSRVAVNCHIGEPGTNF